jgi:hypothetical protein
MIIIKNKVLFMFILFTLIIFVTSFKKLVESSIDYTTIPVIDHNMYQQISTTKSAAASPKCLSLNCNRPVNVNFNVNQNDNTYDNNNGDLAAYCCQACRDSGGLNHVDNCNYSGESYNTTIEPMTGSGLTDSCDGIIDNGNNVCYSTEDNGKMLNNGDEDPLSRGASSFYNCFKDPQCAKYMNKINMSSYLEFEPRNNAAQSENSDWEKNITTMLSFNHFRVHDVDDIDGASDGGVLDNNFCKKLCIKASDTVPPDLSDDPTEDNIAYDTWVELHQRLESGDDEVRRAAEGEKSNAIWRQKMLCNDCRSLGTNKDEYGIHNLTIDPNYRRVPCRAGAQYENTKQIQDQQSIIKTDLSGEYVYDRFNQNYQGDGKDIKLVDDDITIAENIRNGKLWNADSRDTNDLQFGCRLTCAYEMNDKCFSNNPDNNEINTIKTQCREACDKRLPAWVYYPTKIGAGEELMDSGNNWLESNEPDQLNWGDWGKIFSPGV